jgi:hypothetical protein
LTKEGVGDGVAPVFTPAGTTFAKTLPQLHPIYMIKETTQTKEEIMALLDDVCKNILPARATGSTTAERLAPYRAAVMKQRRRGLSWKQIAQALRDPRIGLKISDKVLIKVFGGKTSTTPNAPIAPASTTSKTTPSAPTGTTSTTPVRPPRAHLIIDPATGQRIS